MSRELPKNPNIEFLKKEAKALLRRVQEGDAGAAALFDSGTVKLADAQHLVAREYGFASWPKLKEHVESLSRVLEPMEMLAQAVCASDATKTTRVLERRPELKGQLDEPLQGYGADTL